MQGKKKQKPKKRIGHYILEEKLGQGQFGSVFLAINSKTKGKFAIKCQGKSFLSENERFKQLLNNEIGIMHKINHPNIIHLHDLMESENNYYLILDYCNQGDLQKFMKKRKLKFLPENEAIFFLKQIMNGFKELRKHKVIHRDFKMENIMMHNDTVKIGDFGMAKKGHEIAQTVVGSYLTMAPELLSSDGKNHYSAKCDLWSVGFVFYQILFGDVPFFGLSPHEIFQDIKENQHKLKMRRKVSSETEDLLRSLLKMNPKERLDWPAFFNHPAFEVAFPKSVREFSQADEGERIDEDAVDQEFARNRENVGNSDFNETEAPGFNDLRGDDIQVQEVDDDLNETIYNKNGSQSKKEIARRYYHEKNKILFIVYAVRNIRNFMKNKAVNHLKPFYYCVAIYLLKKAITLSDLNYMSLVNGNNIFEQSGFEEFMESTYLDTIAKCFKNDKPNFEKYFQYLIEKAFEENMENKLKAILADFDEEGFVLDEIDERVFLLYSDLRERLEEFPGENDLAIKFVSNLVSIFYCINSERFFPYKIGGERFDWDSFYKVHESMSYFELVKVVK